MPGDEVSSRILCCWSFSPLGIRLVYSLIYAVPDKYYTTICQSLKAKRRLLTSHINSKSVTWRKMQARCLLRSPLIKSDRAGIIYINQKLNLIILQPAHPNFYLLLTNTKDQKKHGQCAVNAKDTCRNATHNGGPKPPL